MHFLHDWNLSPPNQRMIVALCRKRKVAATKKILPMLLRLRQTSHRRRFAAAMTIHYLSRNERNAACSFKAGIYKGKGDARVGTGFSRCARRFRELAKTLLKVYLINWWGNYRQRCTRSVQVINNIMAGRFRDRFNSGCKIPEKRQVIIRRR